MPSISDREPIQIKWYARRGILVDADLNFRTHQELLRWAAHKVDFVIADMETGEDLTGMLLAHWKEGHLIDPTAKSH
jgi:polyhydroxyalkanoate synthesis regulator protein